MNDFMEFAAYEREALKDGPWELWVKEAEQLAGHDLDDDQSEDGYSLDFAHDAFRAGKSPVDYVNSIQKGAR